MIRSYLKPIAVGLGLASVLVGVRTGRTEAPNTEFRLVGEFGRDIRADVWVPAIEVACAESRPGPIIVRIRSGGGDPGEGARIAAAFSKCQRPVHTLIERIGASAAILPATAGRTVSADPYALVGGIGIVQPMTSWALAAERVGIVDQSVASGRLKLAFNPLQAMAPDDRATIQAVVDEAAETFLAEVQRRRPGFQPDAAIRDGALVTSDQAVALGLIDTVQSIDALRRLHPGAWQDATPVRRATPKDALATAASAVVQGIRAEMSDPSYD